MWRIGDRFRDKKYLDVWEYAGPSSPGDYSPHQAICITGVDDVSFVGEVDSWNFNEENHWGYLGNFGKSNNFTSLYEKLCGKSG